jgi:hypothetical protein
MKASMLAMVAVLLSSVTVAVAEEQTNGIVQDVNVSTGTLKLQSGQTFTFENGAVLTGLLPGQRVGVSHVGNKGIDAFNPHPARRKDIGID